MGMSWDWINKIGSNWWDFLEFHDTSCRRFDPMKPPHLPVAGPQIPHFGSLIRYSHRASSTSAPRSLDARCSLRLLQDLRQGQDLALPVVFSIQKSTPVSSAVAGKSPLNRGFSGKIIRNGGFLWENYLEMGDFPLPRGKLLEGLLKCWLYGSVGEIEGSSLVKWCAAWLSIASMFLPMQEEIECKSEPARI